MFEQLKAVLTNDPPWGVQGDGEAARAPVKWWMTDPTGPAFEAALAAMRGGFGKEPVAIGCGGTIGFVGPLAELFGGAPALLLGIEDPQSNAHAPNESLHEGDWKKPDGVAGAPVRQPGRAAGRQGEVIGRGIIYTLHWPPLAPRGVGYSPNGESFGGS